MQAGVVALPRRPPDLGVAPRLRGPLWALVPLGSIVGVIFAIRFVSDTATGLTWLALIAVPPLAAVALAWAMRGARWWLLAGAAVLFGLDVAFRTSLVGEAAGTLLDALSCVTLGVLLASVAPGGWLKLGILAMTAADVWLVASDLLQAPDRTLSAAVPAPGLPQLQSEIFGSVSMGYGDLFVAGVLGAILAREGRSRGWGALLTLVFGAAFDLLFLLVAELPATVPVALALIALEAERWLRGRRGRGPGSAGASASRRRWTRGGGIPRPAR